MVRSCRTPPDCALGAIRDRLVLDPPDGPPLSTLRARLDSRRLETVAHPRAMSRHGFRECDAAPLGHDVAPPLVPSRTGGRGSLPMPGRPLRGAGPDLHAFRRKGSVPVLPSHLHWDSDPISAHAQEPEILNHAKLAGSHVL